MSKLNESIYTLDEAFEIVITGNEYQKQVALQIIKMHVNKNHETNQIFEEDIIIESPYKEEINTFKIVGRGLVFTSIRNFELGDWIVDRKSRQAYLITAIERMSHTKPKGYVLKPMFIIAKEKLGEGFMK